MSELDGKLDEILKTNAAVQVNFDKYAYDDYQKLVPQIKQAFADAGYVPPENAAKVQTMVNQMAQLAQDAFKVPTIQYVALNKQHTESKMLMTGQEWLERYQQELRGKTFKWGISQNDVATAVMICDHAARKAAGLE